MLSIPFKRGDTFILQGKATSAGLDFTGWTVRCQVRRAGQVGVLGDATITTVSRVVGEWEYEIRVEPTTTQDWPVAKLRADIEYTTAAGVVISTETFEIDCIEDITQ